MAARFQSETCLAHEIFHAVQVQEWDTAKLLDSKTLPTDRLPLIKLSLEGDATIVMMQYMIGGLNQGEEMLSATLDQTKYGMLRQLGMSAKLAVFTGGSANFANASICQALTRNAVCHGSGIYLVASKGSQYDVVRH